MRKKALAYRQGFFAFIPATYSLRLATCDLS
jgi:hypothetical protein